MVTEVTISDRCYTHIKHTLKRKKDEGYLEHSSSAIRQSGLSKPDPSFYNGVRPANAGGKLDHAKFAPKNEDIKLDQMANFGRSDLPAGIEKEKAKGFPNRNSPKQKSPAGDPREKANRV